MANSDNPINVIHSALTPDVYADNAIGIHTFAGNMRITFSPFGQITPAAKAWLKASLSAVLSCRWRLPNAWHILF